MSIFSQGKKTKQLRILESYNKSDVHESSQVNLH